PGRQFEEIADQLVGVFARADLCHCCLPPEKMSVFRPYPLSRGVSGGVDFPDLPGGIGQIGVIHPRCHIVFLGLCEETAEPQRLFEECQGDVERLLPLLDPKRDLPATLARTDMIVAAHAEGIEAQRLLPLARDGDHDRGPFDAVRLPAEQLPVGVEHYMQMRPAIDLVPSIAVLRHGLLHPLWLWLFRLHSRLLSLDVHLRHAVCADAPNPGSAPFLFTPAKADIQSPCLALTGGGRRRARGSWTPLSRL